MRTKHVFIGAFLSLAPLALESCSSDSTTFTEVESGGEGGEGAGGKGGTGGSSGKAGGGGSSGNGGKGGSGGNAGSANQAGGAAGEEHTGAGVGGDAAGAGGRAGNAGSGEAGTGLVSGGGEAGNGGEAGGATPSAGGTTSGQGGASGGEAGAGQSAGEGGSAAGAGGRGTPEELQVCSYECVADEDCDSPGILKYVCDPKTKRCLAPELACTGHRDCVAFASNWSIACENEDACPSEADICVDAGGYGRCARAFAEETPCPLPDQLSVTRTRFGTIEDVLVCGRTNGRCSDGACILGCEGPSDCGTGNGDTCDVESGLCTCLADNECTGGFVSHCNPRTQRCDECASDFDCFLDPSRDECVGGRCGCSSADVCSDVIFPAATPVCE
jgi:hypothetical protein